MADDVPDYFNRRFIVDMTPIRTTHQADLRILRTRDGRQFIGKMANSDIKAWIHEFKLMAGKFAPDKPFDGPIELTLYFAFPNIKADKGKVKPMTTKPDFDNLAKSVCDALTDLGFWNDDSQVVFGKVLKFRTPDPYVGVAIASADWVDEPYCNTIRQYLQQ